MIRHLTLLAAVAGVFSACNNPNFCADREHQDCRFARIDAGTPTCSSDATCTDPAAPVCDLGGSQTCVACTAAEPGACAGGTPVCSTDHTCRGCTAHAECPASLACLPDGSCGSDANVAYVEAAPAGSDNADCTMEKPCIKLSAALATNKPFIKLHGVTDEAVSINDQNVTLIADPGSQLTSTKNGLLLQIAGSSQVKIYDLEITRASGPAGVGISLPTGSTAALELHRVTVSNNVAAGIAVNGGSATISQSTIEANQGGGITVSGGNITVSQSTIGGNQGGGIAVTNGTFLIVGNNLFNNGSNTSFVGGVVVNVADGTTNRLDFNSFALNTTRDGVAPAIQCVGTFTASNNILSNNHSATKTDQVGGTCNHTYSIVHLGALPPGTGNLPSDPLFVDAGNGDLHLQAGSPARHAADPQADLAGLAAQDIDGDPRVPRADIGADQVK